MSIPERVLVCTHLYPDKNTVTPMQQTFAVRNLVESAIGKGVAIDAVVRFVWFVSRKGINLPAIRSVGEVTVINCPRVGVGRFYSKLATRLLFRLLIVLSRKDVNPNRIVCDMASNYGYAREILRFRSAKWIYIIHGSDFYNSEAMAVAASTADLVAASSKAMANQFRSRTGRDVDGVVFFGVDRRFFDSSPKVCDTLRLITACYLIELKHIAEVIAGLKLVVEQHPDLDVRFDIFGNGPLLPSLKTLVTQKGLDEYVIFHGYQPHDVVAGALRKAHVFVMPSSPETFGLAYIEALASGCVVIGHQGWGVDGIVKEGVDGYLVERATPENIAEKVLRYLESDREAMHRAAYETALGFTDERAAENYCEIIRRCNH